MDPSMIAGPVSTSAWPAAEHWPSHCSREIRHSMMAHWAVQTIGSVEAWHLIDFQDHAFWKYLYKSQKLSEILEFPRRVSPCLWKGSDILWSSPRRDSDHPNQQPPLQFPFQYSIDPTDSIYQFRTPVLFVPLVTQEPWKECETLSLSICLVQGAN